MKSKLTGTAGYILCLLPLALALLFFACGTPSRSQKGDQEKQPGQGVIKSIQTVASKDQSTVTIMSSQPTAHKPSYSLKNPPRICLDVMGTPGKDLPAEIKVGDGLVSRILIQDRDPGVTGVVVELSTKDFAYGVATAGPKIVLRVTPPPPKAPAAGAVPDVGADLPSSVHLLGIDVTPFKAGRSRLSIVTDKKTPYKVEMGGPRQLTVSLEKTAVAPLLLKQLASMSPRGAVDDIKAFYSTRDHRVTLKIVLSQMIPYHVSQDEQTIKIEFIAPPKEPPRVATRPRPAEPASPAPRRKPVPGDTRAEAYEIVSRDYAGQKMSFDFVDTDIRNILQLIADVADINIVWGSGVEGKVSMRLDNVPWDQALEMVLRPNGLTYQIENDVLWVVPKATLVDMEMKERNRKSALLAQKRVQGIFEPKILEYLIIKHRKAQDIFKMLVGDPTAVPPVHGVLDIEAGEAREKEKGEEEEGKETKIIAKDIYLTYDPGTNMIIVNGVRSKVEKVKELIAKLDVPEKQVMIEARVVEAETGFTRDLGIQWRSLRPTHKDSVTDEPAYSPGFKREWYNTGANLSGSGEFSTNAPSGWRPTIGIALGWLTDGGLGTIALDASLALGETENKAHVVSAPKVLTVNGGEAVIKRGEVAYKEIRTLDTIDVREMTAALSLSVTPTVSADNSHVTLLVKVTDDRLIPGTSENIFPGKREKTIQTKLMVRTGETVVIGGIYYETRTRVEEGVPWLKEIPILGWLFKADKDERGKVELLIFLTPTVVPTPEAEVAQKGQT